jgi:hypothetical protein
MVLRRFEMRFEQIIAPVARCLAIAKVREICGVVFVSSMRLHLWQVLEPLGMPMYSGSVTGSPLAGDPERINARPGSKRGNQPRQFRLATADC